MGKKKIFLGFIFACTFMILLLIHFTVKDTWSQAPATIRVGGAVSFTGRFASGGLESKFGYEQAVADINLKPA